MSAKPRKPSRSLYFRVSGTEQRPNLSPTDAIGFEMFAERGLRVGDLVKVEVKKPRDYGQLKRAHLIGTLARTQLPGFEKLDAHDAVKQLQIESGVCCEITRTPVGPGQFFETRRPISIGFDEMDEIEFQKFIRGICLHIHETYWPTMSPQAIEALTRLETQRQLAA